MDIKSFIRDLILMNECVILRDFGGFDTSYKNAKIDKNKKTIVPPSKHVTFRADWIKDNGVLEKYISESLKISSEKASEYIDSYVLELKEQIKTKGSILLEGIGKFHCTESGKIEFTSIEDENYLADSFGLDMLDVDIEEKVADEMPFEKKPLPYVPPRKKLTGWYIAIGILLIFISFTVYVLYTGKNGVYFSGLFNKNQHKPEESEMIVFGKQNKTGVDSANQSIGQSLDIKTAHKNALALNKTEPVTKSEPALTTQSKENFNTGSTYYLVAGSFKCLKNAEQLKDKLLKKGFEPVTLSTVGNYTMVIVGTFDNKEDANKGVLRLRQKIGQSIWLMEK